MSAIQWLPNRRGVVAVSCTEALSHSERVARAGRPSNAHILVWNFKVRVRVCFVCACSAGGLVYSPLVCVLLCGLCCVVLRLYCIVLYCVYCRTLSILSVYCKRLTRYSHSSITLRTLILWQRDATTDRWVHTHTHTWLFLCAAVHTYQACAVAMCTRYAHNARVRGSRADPGSCLTTCTYICVLCVCVCRLLSGTSHTNTSASHAPRWLHHDRLTQGRAHRGRMSQTYPS